VVWTAIEYCAPGSSPVNRISCFVPTTGRWAYRADVSTEPSSSP
jgi:hypothetical protein